MDIPIYRDASGAPHLRDMWGQTVYFQGDAPQYGEMNGTLHVIEYSGSWANLGFPYGTPQQHPSQPRQQWNTGQQNWNGGTGAPPIQAPRQMGKPYINPHNQQLSQRNPNSYDTRVETAGGIKYVNLSDGSQDNLAQHQLKVSRIPESTAPPASNYWDNEVKEAPVPAAAPPKLNIPEKYKSPQLNKGEFLRVLRSGAHGDFHSVEGITSDELNLVISILGSKTIDEALSLLERTATTWSTIMSDMNHQQHASLYAKDPEVMKASAADRADLTTLAEITVDLDREGLAPAIKVEDLSKVTDAEEPAHVPDDLSISYNTYTGYKYLGVSLPNVTIGKFKDFTVESISKFMRELAQDSELTLEDSTAIRRLDWFFTDAMNTYLLRILNIKITMDSCFNEIDELSALAADPSRSIITQKQYNLMCRFLLSYFNSHDKDSANIAEDSEAAFTAAVIEFHVESEAGALGLHPSNKLFTGQNERILLSPTRHATLIDMLEETDPLYELKVIRFMDGDYFALRGEQDVWVLSQNQTNFLN